MDEIDRANDEAEAYLAARLREVRAMPPTLLPLGVCLNCEAELDFGRFCDLDCAVDWQRGQDAILRSGARGGE